MTLTSRIMTSVSSKHQDSPKISYKPSFPTISTCFSSSQPLNHLLSCVKYNHMYSFSSLCVFQQIKEEKLYFDCKYTKCSHVFHQIIVLLQFEWSWNEQNVTDNFLLLWRHCWGCDVFYCFSFLQQKNAVRTSYPACWKKRCGLLLVSWLFVLKTQRLTGEDTLQRKGNELQLGLNMPWHYPCPLLLCLYCIATTGI